MCALRSHSVPTRQAVSWSYGQQSNLGLQACRGGCVPGHRFLYPDMPASIELVKRGALVWKPCSRSPCPVSSSARGHVMHCKQVVLAT
jgi:hypothetical protein